MAEGRKMSPRGNSRLAAANHKFDKNSFKRLLGYFKKYRLRFIFVVICIILSSVVQVASQLFLKRLIDDYILPLVDMENPIYTPLLHFLSVLAIIYVFGIIATFTYNRIMIGVSQGILKDIRDDMFNHMQTLPISYFDTHSHGDIMSKYTKRNAEPPYLPII